MRQSSSNYGLKKRTNTFDLLFVDYTAAFDSLIRDRVFVAMSELGISAKLIRLCRMMLSNSYSSVKVRI